MIFDITDHMFTTNLKMDWLIMHSLVQMVFYNCSILIFVSTAEA